MRVKTKLAVLLLCALFMGTVAYSAYADSSLGNVTVSAEIPRFENFVFVGSATPDTFLNLSFNVAYGNILSSGDEVWVHLYSAGLTTPDLSCSGKPSTLSTFNHYAAMWIDSAAERDGKGWDWDCDGVVAAKPYFSSPVAPTVRPVTTSPTHLGFSIKFNQLADATNPKSIDCL